MYPAIKETEIRPDHLMARQAELYLTDVYRLMESSAEFVLVACPACQVDSAAEKFRKYGLRYVECSRCGTMYVSPRPTPGLLERYYTTSENHRYWNQYIFPASEASRREKIFRPRAERLAAICAQHGIAEAALLEVGAGFGTFCEEARRLALFRRVIAVEPGPDLAASCRQRGLEVLNLPVEQVHLEDQRIDVIASFEVIEHLFAPQETIQQCYRLLSPGGLLVLTCPNGRGFEVMTLGAVSTTVDAEHLNYFHPESLSHLVSRCGFSVLEVFTPGRLDAELVRKKVLSGELDLAGQPWLREVLVEQWERLGEPFQDFLAANRLSSHMWLVARKPA